MLSHEHARVELVADLDGPAGAPCIVVRGEQAQLNARGHTLRAAGVGVRVEGRGARVRNLHVTGGSTGFVLAAPDAATLYHVATENAAVGISVEASPGARIVRAEVRGGRVGIAFGAPEAWRCPAGGVVRSPGAAVLRSHVEGAEVGIAACDALPVLAGNTVTRNGVGIVLGAPAPAPGGGPGASAPYDPCACAPALDGVHPGTTLLQSSGCSGCEVHEGWLPGLRAAGADIRLRETGAGAAGAGQRFDDFVDHCAPELTNVLGIPGSVPNYGCLADGRTWKVRTGDETLEMAAAIQGPDDVARFASGCVAEAARRYVPGSACVRGQLWANTACANRTVDIRAAAGARRLGGADDSCANTEDWSDTGLAGCARPCDGSLVPDAPAVAPTRLPQPTRAAPVQPPRGVTPAVPTGLGPRIDRMETRRPEPQGGNDGGAGPVLLAVAAVAAALLGARALFGTKR